MSARDTFRAAIAAMGLTPPDEIIGDGSRQRFSSSGKRGDDSGWYRFWDDARPGGVFGCWRAGVNEKWQADSGREFSPEERAEWKRRMQAAEAERAAEELKRRERAASQAAEMWGRAHPANGHAYLERKGINGAAAAASARELDGVLLVPVKQGPRELVGLQRIAPDGDKKFLPGTPAGGGYTTIGRTEPGKPVVIVEGYATGMSVHLATGWCVVVAFNAGNLEPVARKIRAAMPAARLIIGADDDAFTVRPEGHPQAGQPWNPGAEAADAAAQCVDAETVRPVWVDSDRGRGTDFNDLHAAEGLEAVRNCFPDLADPDPSDQPQPPASTRRAQPASGANNPGSTPAANLAAGRAVVEPPPPVPPFNEEAARSDVPHETARARNTPRELSPDAPTIFASKPLEAAQLFHDSLPEGGRILFWRGEFFSWDGCRYVVRDKVWIEQRIYQWSASCVTWRIDPKTGDHEVVAFDPTAKKVGDIAHALRAVCYADLPEPQCWIDRQPGDPDPGEFIAFRNGFLHWPTRRLIPATDRLFLVSALEFDYDPHAPPPAEWLQFLAQAWPGDQESIDGLADMFGYMLTDDTSQQKLFLLIGPPRSGKGTILRVLESLVGYSNRVSPSLAGLGTQFGLQPLIGKRLAMISDARLSGKSDQQPIVENLLRISGEDSITIDRKNIGAWSGKLSTRFVMATNELPAFSDASAALANRFIIWRLTESFLGREDRGLTGRLLAELPSIVVWALDGLDRLQRRGYVVAPRASEEMAADLIDQTSPMRSFVLETCVIGEGNMVGRDELFAAWRKWCTDQGRDHPGTKISFGRQLAAAFPTVRRAQIGARDSARTNMYVGIRMKHGFESEEPPL